MRVNISRSIALKYVNSKESSKYFKEKFNEILKEVGGDGWIKFSSIQILTRGISD